MARELGACTIEAMVRGYHVYREVWCAAVGEELSCVREVNYRDPFASLLRLLPRLTTTALSLTEGHVDLEASMCR